MDDAQIIDIVAELLRKASEQALPALLDISVVDGEIMFNTTTGDAFALSLERL